MKRLFAGSLLAILLAAAPAFAAERPTSPPVKGTEGPDVRATQDAPSRPSVPVKGVEGPGIR